MTYAQLTRFMLPLMLTALVQELSGQFLNGGMARMPRATETLAAFGLAYGIASLLSGILTQARQLSLVLVEHDQGYRTVFRFAILAGLALSGVLALCALTPLGDWLIGDLHGVEPSLTDVVLLAFLWLIPYPFLRGMTRIYIGTLLRIRRSEIPAYGTTAGIGLSILTVFLLLPIDFVQRDPILLPVLATYAGVVTELAVVVWGHWRHVRFPAQNDAPALEMSYVLRFFWPLALIMAVQSGTRPLINIFVAREADGTEALAVLTIVYALGHIPYGWLNEVRNLPTAFREANDLAKIRRFIFGCGLFSFVWMAAIVWTPAADYLLQTWIGISPELVAHCLVPLSVFCGFPIVVSIRSYIHGIGLLEHRTRAMAPSAPSRVATVVL
ncbi:hypothetical protein OAF45_02650, partial [Candidatus Latescibacteria bacterium]|nr:hypothetical protein [Candidatus Latescibacterota bacterium]